ncbi:MAG: L-glutamate gamma-semialdehyde dehydrogenase [Thermoleophilia bacterium]
MSTHAIARPPLPANEPVRGYAPGSPERASLRARLAAMRSERPELPCLIGGREVRTGRLVQAVEPHDRARVLADVHEAGAAEVESAIRAGVEAQRAWGRTPWETRAAVLLRAAELLAGPWRDTLNAATMLGQSKTPHQAEIDAACETIDFLRFNPAFLARLLAEQPESAPGTWNRLDYRPLEGFVLAISPFNFTSIGVNLATAPLLLGNAVVWKPASTAMPAAYHAARLLEAAGLPPGVLNLVFAPGPVVADVALASPDLAGVHFTGSTGVFQGIWRTVGQSVDRYRSYPRLVGETGGKGFVVAHASADVDALATALVRGAFEYQGQKCSAASRAFVPRSLWPALRERLVEDVRSLRLGDPTDFASFAGAVIDERAFAKQRDAIAEARAHGDTEIVVGGGTDDAVGWFVEPTVVETRDPSFRLLRDELFGPVLTVLTYADDRYEEVLDLVDRGAPYALTGAVFARDRAAIDLALERLRDAAGNVYVNDKPTGAVVGQQPFGGGRASGTNDKAGSLWNLIRWTSPRTIKETFVPPTDYRYPFLEPDAGADA